RADEAVTLLSVEPLHGALGHDLSFNRFDGRAPCAPEGACSISAPGSPRQRRTRTAVTVHHESSQTCTKPAASIHGGTPATSASEVVTPRSQRGSWRTPAPGSRGRPTTRCRRREGDREQPAAHAH